MSFEGEKPLIPGDGEKLGRVHALQWRYEGFAGAESVPNLSLESGAHGVPQAHGAGHSYGERLFRPEIGRALTDAAHFIKMSAGGGGGRNNSDSEDSDSVDGLSAGPGAVGRSDCYSVLSGEDAEEDDAYSLESEHMVEGGKAPVEGPMPMQYTSLSVAEAYRRRQEEWAERGAAKLMKDVRDPQTGQITRQLIKKGIKDFKFGEALGDGSYSTVVLATCIESGKKYAAKILNKEYLIKQKKVKYVNIEKNTLQRLNSSRVPGVIKLYFTFQDEANLYFLLEYAPNGDFLSVMKRFGTLSEECTKYYGAQILDAIHHLHKQGIIHRDVKPENILLDKTMKIKLTDFGTAKLIGREDENKPYDLNTRSKSFVGTAEYVSPELLNDNYVDSRCDIWAFGCILFQMVAGKPPFKATNEYLTFQKVMRVQYAFTAGFPMILRDLIKQLLVKKPEQRLTILQIEKHHFFNDINFRNGSVWSNPAPQIAPYKVTAKAMQSVPVKSTKSQLYGDSSRKQSISKPSSSSSSVPSSQRQTQTAPGTSSSVAEPVKLSAPTSKLDSQTARILEHARNEIRERKNMRGTSASAAAAALYGRRPSNSSVWNGNHSPPSASVKTPHSAPAHTAQSSSSHGSPTSTANSGQKSSTQMSKADILWSFYLLKLDERIIKTGDVQITTIKNIDLEGQLTKLNGLLVQPLKNNSKPSFLTNVVRNGKSTNGQTNSDRKLQSMNEQDYYVESEIAWDNVKDERRDRVTVESGDDSGTMFNRLRRFFGSRSDDSFDGFRENTRPLHRTMVLTSYGRCLIFTKMIKPSPVTDLPYEIQYELNLCKEGVSIKEIVTDGNETGLFVIQTPFRSFIFKCGMSDVDQWTAALQKSIRLNNERLALEGKDEGPSEVANLAARMSVGRQASTPKTPNNPIMRSPSKQQHASTTPVKNRAGTQHVTPNNKTISAPGTPALKPNGEGKHERLFESFINRKNTEKQPVQPVPQSSTLVHGLPLSSPRVRVVTPRSSVSASSPHSTRHKSVSSRMFTRTDRSLRR
ncbi:AFR335Cp [Eremothecium gossypii ATCC 10895]|uniref:non-specific serine/threonine protein kinase n=1 Tax=Eremothecium gossypii (strain ATCC 10895 / CBS 109.51 / FGSC 9923 / NRRL Y-1056) TaxID=284811 RepID=Q753H7_EREGS|nr:AFR335Cp [Eremothecium gossypii ATCC 10895]AAS53706.1 AFR335Cp [Eremothecium gossypii ATCC 10895]AEY98019.1 FAFR335Cp [Eremothecium gossypii FDAG1]